MILQEPREKVRFSWPSDGDKISMVAFVESFFSEPSDDFLTLPDLRRATYIFVKLIRYDI